jgi:hypothetical protein
MTALTDPLTELGGMPFLDATFADRRLLAAAAAARHVEAERRGAADAISDTGIEAWLAPARIVMLRPSSARMPATALSPARRDRVNAALEQLTLDMPAWEPLLRLPVRYALLHPSQGAISASSRAWPQHVLLADAAFATHDELREQIVHELCHQWLYLIQEVWALDSEHATQFTLPSGTSDRRPSEVLGAAHVAVTLTRLYRTCGTQTEDRIADLGDYGADCLRLLDTHDNVLTSAGWQIARRLKEAL